MAHGKDITGTNIQIAVEYFLKNNVGLSNDEIAKLKNILSSDALSEKQNK